MARRLGRKGTAINKPFEPTRFTSLQAWYDAKDTATITEGATFTWADKSGNGYDATQSTGASQPATGTNTLNGNNVITFDGTNDFLTLPSALCSAIPNGDSTIFVVSRQDSIGQERIITMATAANSTRLQVRYNSTTGYPAFQNNNTGSLLAGLAGFDSLDYNIITVGHSDSTMTLGANASAEGSNANGADVADASIGTIGSTGNGGGDYLNGDIAEILIYNRVLSAAEKAKIHRYLYQKWGVVIKGTLVIPTKGSVVVPFNVTYDGYTFDTDVDMNDYKITPTNSYSITNSSGNTPNQQIAVGNATSAPYQITYGLGYYSRFRVWDNTNPPTQDFNFIGTSSPSLTSSDSATYAQSGATNAYFATISAGASAGLTSVYDTTVTDADGKFEELTLAASQAACESTAGTYFLTGTTLYIHASDSRSLAGNNITNGVLVLINAFGAEIDEEVTGYLEGINMYGFGVSTFTAGVASDILADGYNLYVNGGNFGYTTGTSNAISVVNSARTIIKDANVYDAARDGINNHYYLDVGVQPEHYEINCKVYNSGANANDNSTTLHETVYGLSVGCTYDGAADRNVHIIDSSFGVYVGCSATNARSGFSEVNFVAGTGSDASTMYLINCKSTGSTNDLIVGSGSTIYVTPASRLLDGNNTEDGTITTFIPQVI